MQSNGPARTATSVVASTGNVDRDGEIVGRLAAGDILADLKPRLQAFAGDPALQARMDRLAAGICACSEDLAAAQLEAVARMLP